MKLKEKLGDKYNDFLQILKEKGIKENEVDLIDGFVPRSRLNEVSDKLKATEDKNKILEIQSLETKKLLEESEKFKSESEEYKTKYSELENKHKSELESKDNEISNVKKRSLVKERLINEGVKHTKLLMNEIDFDKVNIDNEQLTNFDDTLKSVKESYPDMFTVTKNTQNGLNTGNTGEGGEGGEGSDFSFLDNIKS